MIYYLSLVVLKWRWITLLNSLFISPSYATFCLYTANIAINYSSFSLHEGRSEFNPVCYFLRHITPQPRFYGSSVGMKLHFLQSKKQISMKNSQKNFQNLLTFGRMDQFSSFTNLVSVCFTTACAKIEKLQKITVFRQYWN